MGDTSRNFDDGLALMVVETMTLLKDSLPF